MNEISDHTGTDDSGALSLSDYLAIARRRLFVILFTTMAVTLIAVVVVKRMPDMYRAETTILVDPQQVPSNYVASTVSTSINDRLSTVHQEVTSPTRLKRVIESMHLFPELLKTQSEQVVIAQMQKAITVKVDEQGSHSMSTFKVAFVDKDPKEAAEIANKLAELFISENLKAREKQSYGTAEFLDDELKRTKDQLDQKQSELNDVKSKYMLDLPDSKQYHLEALATLRTQLQASQDRVAQDQQQKVYLQTMVVSQPPTIDMDSGSATDLVYAPQIQKLEAKLSAEKARYGEKYPDVRATEAEINDLRAKQKAAMKNGDVDAPPVIHESASTRSMSRNPVLAAQVQRLDDDITREKKQQQLLQAQIAFHTSKLEKIPVFEQKISGLMWDYDSLRSHYSDLQSKKLSADMSSALETHDKGERFVVLDRAVVPGQPFSPKRGLVSIGALFAGIALGLALAVLIEIMQNAVHSRSDVIELLGETPILADIPTINLTGEVHRRRLLTGGAFVGTAALSVLVGLAISYLTNKP